MPGLQTWVLVCDECADDFYPPPPAPKKLGETKALAERVGWTWTFHEPPGGRGLGWYTYRCPACTAEHEART